MLKIYANEVLKLSLCSTQDTLHLLYKDRSRNSVHGNNRSLI
jgi:hypothetical protein